MLLIYIPKITPRIRYTFKTVFKTYLGFQEYNLTTDLEKFNQDSGAKFSYSSKALANELYFFSSGLLEQNGIKEQSISVGEFEGTITLFPTKKDVELPFDVFSAIFYSLSRYEEYLPHMRDQYDRFKAKDSIASEHGYLQTAVVDRWAIQLRMVLKAKFPNLIFENRVFSYIPTIDIDNAYAYKHKGILRTIGSLGKTVSKFDFSTLMNQIKVLLGQQKDPFDTYNYQLNIHKKYYLKPIYFILIGDYGLNDKNLSFENRHFRTLIKTLSDYAFLGIHPSFGSNKRREKLKVEIGRLRSIMKSDIKRSRQHFLKLSLPETYRNLLEADIEEDYTMGFASELGFRAGTCTPYSFYDLDEEVECKLTVFPFQVMEATLKYYLNLSVEDSIEAIKKIVDEIKSVNGTFVSLWHNESLSEEKEWNGWQKVYEEMIAYTTDNIELK
ncbi:MAG: polysaccharide deacetylase family protein [Flavobacteriales bacterium]|nr:polysaccharide deacetylase family protein [Flavobacteriales bacterium]